MFVAAQLVIQQDWSPTAEVYVESERLDIKHRSYRPWNPITRLSFFPAAQTVPHFVAERLASLERRGLLSQDSHRNVTRLNQEGLCGLADW